MKISLWMVLFLTMVFLCACSSSLHKYGRMGGRGAILKKLPRPPHLEKFRLEPDERELLELVDGKKTLYELCESGPASAGANARVLYAFAELQMLTVDPSSSGKILIQVRG